MEPPTLDRQPFASWQRFKLALRAHPSSDFRHHSLVPAHARVTAISPDAADSLAAFDTLTLGTSSSSSIHTLRTSASDGDFFRKLSSRTSTSLDDSLYSPASIRSSLRHDLILPDPAFVPPKPPSLPIAVLPHSSCPTPVPTAPTPTATRAVALFAKYGIKLDNPNACPSQPIRPSTIQRVQRVIRLRVQHHCHQCRGPMIQDNVCARCSHQRCRKCLRSSRFGFRDRTTTAHQLDGDPDEGQCPTELKRRRSPSVEAPDLGARASACNRPAQGGSSSMLDRLWKRPRQRLRFNCEDCGRTFEDKSAVCADCGHRRCERCPPDV